MRSNKKLKMLLLIVAVLLVGVTVAYAALSATLNVTVNKVTQNAGSFSVVFNNTGSSVAATTVGGTSATGRSCGTATITASSVTISDTQLSKPDDSCQYTLVLKNTGTITAKLVSITPTNPSGTTCSTSSGARMICGASGKEITYTITTNPAATTLLTTSTSQVTSFAANATLTVYLTAKYTGSALNSTAVNQTGASFTLNWGQV